MSTSRPTLLRTRVLSAAAALTVTAALSTAPAATAQPAASYGAAKAKSAPQAKRAPKAKGAPMSGVPVVKGRGTKRLRRSRIQQQQTGGIIARWTGIPKSGEYAGRTITDTYAFGGRLFSMAHLTTAPDFFSIWGPLYDDATASLAPVTENVEIWPTKNGGYCVTSAQWLSGMTAYVNAFQRSIEAIEAWRTDAALRSALPAGPTIAGRTTVNGTVGLWPTLDRSGAVATLDSETGAVLRITPTGFSDFSVDLSSWTVTRASKPELLAVADSAGYDPARYATDLCR